MKAPGSRRAGHGTRRSSDEMRGKPAQKAASGAVRLRNNNGNFTLPRKKGNVNKKAAENEGQGFYLTPP